MTRPTPPGGRGLPMLAVGGALVLLLCVPFLPGSRPAAAPSAGEDDLLQSLTRDWTREFFPGDPATYPVSLTDPLVRRIHSGREVFRKYCIGCHGGNADGRGEAAAMLVPRPRNFRYGVDAESPPIFKFRSTASGEPPLRADLVRTIRNGLRGSSMPGHRLVDQTDVEAVADYILWVARTSEFAQAVQLAYEDEEPDLAAEEARQEFHDEFIAAEAERVRTRYGSPHVLSIGSETPASPESVRRGGEIYVAQGCQECHGAAGRGDGSSAPGLQDSWGFPIDPRDFSTGRFRAGSTPHDIYLRIRGGVSGTPMPSFEDLPDTETWDLVHFILSLSEGGGR